MIKKKKEYKRVPEKAKVGAGIPGLAYGEMTYKYEDEPKEEEVGKEKNKTFQIHFDPELKGELFPDSNSIVKCRVNFFSKKGTVVIYKIYQHKGGESLSNTRMKIKDESGEAIDGGWSKTNVMTVNENVPKGIFLIFYRKETLYEPANVDNVGVKIETSEGDYRREFDIRWNM